MATIHPSAVVSPKAEIADDIEVGPFCTIESGAVIGEGCRLEARVTVKEGTILGRNNLIGEGAVIGARAQHVHNGPVGGKLIVGDRNQVREYVTFHRAFKPEDTTVIGSDNMFMVGSHVAHDCKVGNHVILVNNALLGGHVEVGDRAFISGAVGIHQFCRVGAYAMVGAHTKVVKDIPPYVTVDGYPSAVIGLNKVGLRRAGFAPEAIQNLREAYRLIYRRGLRWTEVLEALKTQFTSGPAAEFALFFSKGKRGFTPERRTPRAATLRLHTDDEGGEESASDGRKSDAA